MNDVVRIKLVELLERLGPAIVDEPARMEGVLKDVAGEHKREIFVLVAALKERVGAELKNLGQNPRHLVLLRLTKRLEDNLALSEGAARWAVESWALALGVMQPSELSASADEDAAPQQSAASQQSSIVVDPSLSAPVPGSWGAPDAALQQSEPIQPQFTIGPQPGAPGVEGPKRQTMQLSSTTVVTHVVSRLGRGTHMTIASALRQAAPGDRIVVKPGVYVEGLLVDKAVEIVGDGPRDEIIVETAEADCLASIADYAVVRGLTFRARGAVRGKEFFGVDVARGRLVLEECDVTSDSLACVAVHGARANPILRHCVIRDGNQAGVMVYEGAEATIEDCDVVRNTLGIAVAGGANPTVRRCNIADGKTGLYVYESGKGLFEDCTIHGHSLAEVQIRKVGNPTLRRTRIRDGKSFGIYVYDKGYGTVEECDIFGMASSQVVVFQGGNPVFRRTQVHDGRGEGVYVFEDGRGLFEDCDIFGMRNACVVAVQGGNPTLHRSKVHDGETVGVFVGEGGRGDLRDCAISGHAGACVDVEKGGDPSLTMCRITGGQTVGVQVRASGRGTFEGCDIGVFPVAGVRILEQGFPVVRRCHVHDMTYRGILVENGGMGLLDACHVEKNGSVGVEVTTHGDPVVRESQIHDNAAYGIYVHDAGAGTVEKCDLRGNAMGAWDIGDDCSVKRTNNRT